MILQILSWGTMVILPLKNLPKKLAQDGRDWWKHWISSYDNVALCFDKACLDVKLFCKTILATFYLLHVHSMTTHQFSKLGSFNSAHKLMQQIH